MRIVPDPWKVALVTPIFKEGDETIPTNYHPISVLPVTMIILEHHIHDQIYNYVLGEDLLCREQSGFRKCHSTVTATLDVLDNIYWSVDEGCASGLEFLDLRKAFDMVDHSILLNKLHKMNIRDSANMWVKSYLTNLIQRTKVNGVVSDPGPVVCAVPQGSILGPLLFILYMNDIRSVWNFCKLLLYADDIQ